MAASSTLSTKSIIDGEMLNLSGALDFILSHAVENDIPVSLNMLCHSSTLSPDEYTALGGSNGPGFGPAGG